VSLNGSTVFLWSKNEVRSKKNIVGTPMLYSERSKMLITVCTSIRDCETRKCEPDQDIGFAENSRSKLCLFLAISAPQRGFRRSALTRICERDC
jgi:hypothetical protein